MKVLRLEKVDSTNIYAKNNLTDLEDKTVIIASSQTSGRGRLNRSWVDLGENNLFMSIVLKPSMEYKENFANLTQYLSVCLCKVLDDNYGLKSQIKWPNDVLIDGKKIAGILSESVVSGSNFKGLVLGIGVNLNAKKSDVDAIVDKIATSLNLEINKEVGLEKFTTQLLDEFFSHYEEFLSIGFEYIKTDYISRNCFLDKELNVQTFNEIKSGVAKEIDSTGALVLKTKENNDVVLTIGDIL